MDNIANGLVLSKSDGFTCSIIKFNNGFKSFTGFYIDSLQYWINKQKTISIFIILIICASAYLFNFSKKELLPMEDRGSYLIIGSTDEGSSFEYTQEKAQIIESRILRLLQADDSPYERLIMRVPGFGRSATTYNTFIIIALLDEWKNREISSYLSCQLIFNILILVFSKLKKGGIINFRISS